MAREISAGTAAVLSFGSLQAGIDHNSIPEKAVIKGSIRCQDDEVKDFLGERLKTVCEKIAEAFRGTCTVELHKGSTTIINDSDTATLARTAIAKVLGKECVTDRVSARLMAADDFTNYGKIIPAVYFFLHTNNKEKGIVQANHDPYFDIDEEVLYKGVAAYTAIALEYLNQ